MPLAQGASDGARCAERYQPSGGQVWNRNLTNRSKQIDPRQIEQLVGQVAAQREAGREVIVVFSGAVGAGMGVLNIAKRPTDLSDLQACAAVGQSALMSTYTELLRSTTCKLPRCSSRMTILRTRIDAPNARNTLVSLLAKGVVPIVNENDAQLHRVEVR